MRRWLRAVVPRNALTLVRSARAARQIGILPQWIATLRKRRSSLTLGTEYGGWTIPADSLDAGSVCYCIGCGEDISFDLALLERYNCRVYGFDPTPRSIAYVRSATACLPNYSFFDFGIWHSDGTVKFFAPADDRHVSHSITNLAQTDTYIEVPTRRLSGVLRELGHERLALLKLDIEGAEGKVIETIIQDRIAIDVLLVEFDELGFPDAGRQAGVAACVRSLFEHGFQLYDVRGLNFTFVFRPSA